MGELLSRSSPMKYFVLRGCGGLLLKKLPRLMKLIIAEKPSLARNIADAIGNMKRRDGYLESPDYLVTWAFGHLFTLANVEDYETPVEPGNKSGNEPGYKPGKKARWTLANLPCFPQQFRFLLKRKKDGSIDEGVEKQFRTIRTLCRRDDVDSIINAGDADREGEIIVRLCIIKSSCPGKRFLRLWLPDQTPQTVLAAL